MQDVCIIKPNYMILYPIRCIILLIKAKPKLSILYTCYAQCVFILYTYKTSIIVKTIHHITHTLTCKILSPSTQYPYLNPNLYT